MSHNWEEDDRSNTSEEEEYLCSYCGEILQTVTRLQIHQIKCGKRHKGYKELVTCPYNATHLIPAREYKDHVKKCELDRGDEKGFDEFKLENIKASPDTEETGDVPAVKTRSLVDDIKIKVFDTPRERTYDTTWGLSKNQRKEWRVAEYQRIQNIINGRPYDDIEYPRANGTYVTLGEIIKKIRYGSIGNAEKSIQDSSTEESIEENSKNVNSDCSSFKVSDQKKKKENKAVNCYEISSIWSEYGEQSEARKKNKNRKNCKESSYEENSPNETSNYININSSEINDRKSGEQPGNRKKTKNWRNKKLPNEAINPNGTSNDINVNSSDINNRKLGEQSGTKSKTKNSKKCKSSNEENKPNETSDFININSSDFNNPKSGEKSGGRKKTKTQKNCKESSIEENSLNGTSNSIDINSLDINNPKSGENSGARKKTNRRNGNEFTDKGVNVNETSSKQKKSQIENQSSKNSGTLNEVKENRLERPVNIYEEASNVKEKPKKADTGSSSNSRKAIPNDTSSSKKTNWKNCNIKNEKASSKCTNIEYSESVNSVKPKKKR